MRCLTTTLAAAVSKIHFTPESRCPRAIAIAEYAYADAMLTTTTSPTSQAAAFMFHGRRHTQHVKKPAIPPITQDTSTVTRAIAVAAPVVSIRGPPRRSYSPCQESGSIERFKQSTTCVVFSGVRCSIDVARQIDIEVDIARSRRRYRERDVRRIEEMASGKRAEHHPLRRH